MTRYRKRPVEVEAFQVIEGDTVPDWLLGNIERGFAWFQNGGGFGVRTKEGVLRAEIGDWIIQGVKGEIYPCKPDIFEMTYDKVDERNGLYKDSAN